MFVVAVPRVASRTREALAAACRRVAASAWAEPAAFIIAITLAFALLFRRHYSTRPWAIQDFTPWFRTTADAWTVFRSAWGEQWLGSFNPGNPGVWVAQTVLTLVIPSAGLTQRLFYLGQLPLAAIGMYFLLRYLRITPWLRMLVATLYAVNGFTIPLFQLGAIPTLVVHTAFPWYLLATLRFYREPRGRAAWLLLSVAVLALVSLFQPYALVRLSPFFGAFLAMEIALRRRWSYAWRTLAATAVAIVLLVLLTAPFSLDQFENVIRQFTSAGSSQGLGLYSSVPIDEILYETRVAFQYPQTVQAFESLTILALLLLALIMRLRACRRSVDVGVLMTVGLLALLWARLLEAGHLYQLFRAVPPLLIFRNPDKLAEIAFEAFVPVLAIALDDVWLWIRRGQSARGAVAAAGLGVATAFVSLFVVISDAQSPYDRRLQNTRQFFLGGGLNPSLQSIGPVPRTFDEVTAWLDARRAQEGEFRTLWLPAARDVHSAVIPTYDRSALVVNQSLAELVLEPLVEGPDPEFPQIIAEFGVKYVVIARPEYQAARLQELLTGPPGAYKLPNSIGNAEITGDPERFRRIIEAYPEFQRRASADRWTVYENSAFVGVDRAFARVYLLQQATSPVIRTARNLLRNPDLDTNGQGWDLPEITNTTYRLTGERGPQGAVLQITVGEGGGWGELAQPLPVRNGQYMMAIWARAKATQAVSFRIYFSDDAGKRVLVGTDEYLRVNFRLPKSGSAEWQEVSRAITVPVGATHARLIFEARPNADPQGVAVTEFAGPYFASLGKLPLAAEPTLMGQGNDPPKTRLPLLGGASALIRSVPFVDGPANLILYSDLADSPQTLAAWRALADVAVLLGDAPPEVTSPELLRAQRILQIFEAERQVVDDQAEVTVERSSEYSGGSAVRGTSTQFDIVPPRAGRYRVLVNGPLAAPAVVHDTATYALQKVDTLTGVSPAWWSTDPIEIGPRTQRLRITARTRITIDQIALVSASPGELLRDALAPPAPRVEWRRQHPSQHTARIDAQTPALLFLGQQFDSKWEARTADGAALAHGAFGLWGWANGYRIDAGAAEVTFEFTRQRARDQALVVFFVSWTAVLVAVAALFGASALRAWRGGAHLAAPSPAAGAMLPARVSKEPP